jgi:DNA-binding transcriptional ArsR family regulator
MARANGTTTAANTTKAPARKPAPATAAPTRPRPIPREVRSAAAALAALGDPHRLAILGHLAGGEILTPDAVATLVGLDADAATAALNQLKKRGFAEAARVAGAGWTYRISDEGAKALVRAMAFAG